MLPERVWATRLESGGFRWPAIPYRLSVGRAFGATRSGEAQQLATAIGWQMHGVKGGLIAGTLFVVPGFLAVLALSILYLTLGQVTLVEGLFLGLRAAVLAIVLQALVRLSKRVLGSWPLMAIASAAFLAIGAMVAVLR